MKAYIFNMNNYIIIAEAEEPNDAARAIIDAIREREPGRICRELAERAKADRATLKDIIRHSQPAAMERDGDRVRLYVRGFIYMDIPADDPGYIIRTAEKTPYIIEYREQSRRKYKALSDTEYSQSEAAEEVKRLNESGSPYRFRARQKTA